MSQPIVVFTVRTAPDYLKRQHFEMTWTKQSAPGYGSAKNERVFGVIAEHAQIWRDKGFQITIDNRIGRNGR